MVGLSVGLSAGLSTEGVRGFSVGEGFGLGVIGRMLSEPVGISVEEEIVLSWISLGLSGRSEPGAVANVKMISEIITGILIFPFTYL